MPAIKFSLVGAVLLLAAVSSQALTLGRMRGAALVGQGLELVIQVQVDADDNPGGLCFEADVFHGDTRQEPAGVRVTVEPASGVQSANVRIVSSNIVDEPVVTVYLRAGCAQKISRRYVLLADVVTEQAVALVPRVAAVPLITPAAAAGNAAGASSVGDAPVAGVSAPPAVSSSAPSSTVPGAGAKSVTPAVGAKPPAPVVVARKPARPKASPATLPPKSVDEKLLAGRSAGQSRLKLDPLEVLSERVATLESSSASVPADIAAREARDAQRLQALEASVKNLLAIASRNESSLLELKARLQQAESEQYLNPVVYGLIALLLLTLGGIAFLLARNRRQVGAGSGNWWSGSDDEMPAAAVAQTMPASPRTSGFSPVSVPAPLSGPDSLPAMDPSEAQATRPAGPQPGSAPVTQVDVSLVEMSESTFDRLMQTGVTHSAIRKPRTPDPVDRKAINSDELFDIRQQAEFFVSLGQTDQAVRILENRISENGESSPLAYLDLLKIFHSLGLRADFRQVREDFSLLFNARVPEFSDFANQGKDLEAYPQVIASIVAAWGTPAVLASIETVVFRHERQTSHDLVDLAAFRELLLLHAVAQTTDSPPTGALSAALPAVRHTPLMERTSGTAATGFGEPVGRVDEDLSGIATEAPLPSLDGVPELDIDLSDLHGSAPTPSAAPVIAGVDVKPPIEVGNLIDFDLDLPPKISPR